MRTAKGLSWIVPAMCFLCPSLSMGQQLIERVVARVNGYAVTLTDLDAAIALGIVETTDGADGIERLVDRQLVLEEVERFAPPEPDDTATEREATRLVATVGSGLTELMQSTGLDAGRIKAIARDNLRIQAYLDQRFGTTVQLTEDEVTQYYRIHPDEFTRGGMLSPFVEVEALVRERASGERRTEIVSQWVRDLRMRADVTLPRR